MMEDGSDIAREAIFEAIENQIRENDPPITKETYDRLRTDGHTHEETMKLIGCALSVELFEIMKKSEPFNAQRYTSNLKGLPELPWEE
jgi:peroxiredoxin family protein